MQELINDLFFKLAFDDTDATVFDAAARAEIMKKFLLRAIKCSDGWTERVQKSFDEYKEALQELSEQIDDVDYWLDSYLNKIKEKG